MMAIIAYGSALMMRDFQPKLKGVEALEIFFNFTKNK